MDEDALARGKVEGEMCKAVRNEAELELMVPRVKAPKDKLTVAICEGSWWRRVDVDLCTNQWLAVGEREQVAADCSGGRGVWNDPELLWRWQRTGLARHLSRGSAGGDGRAENSGAK